MVKQATGSDPELQEVRNAIENGDIINVQNCDPLIKKYVRYWDELWVQDGVVILKDRTVIPQQLRERVLENLHAAHQGVTQMLARAENSIFWPGLHTDLEEVRLNCRTCRVNAPSMPKLPPHEPPQPDYPFQMICSDYLFLEGIPYLITVCRLTGWPDVRRSKHADSGTKEICSPRLALVRS